MGNLELYEKVRSVPEGAQKTIEAGRTKGFTDINPMWRIKTLTEQFGVCGIGWFYRVTKRWTETIDKEVAAFVDIELYIKVDGEWSMPICGTGGSKLASNEKNSIHMSDECFKMATTDALSVSCKQLGIGADIYYSRDETKHNKNIDNQTKNKVEQSEKYACEKCGKEFVGFVFKNKHYTAAEEYANAKKASNGRVLCKKCKAELSPRSGLTQAQMKTIYSELCRVGYQERYIHDTYNVSSVQELTIEQFKKCMEGLTMLPPKVQ